MSPSYRLCSICRTPIDFGQKYFRCSVSTCNRSRVALYFCSLPCWDAHLPDARHREAWAEPVEAPSREDWEREQAAAVAARARASAARAQPGRPADVARARVPSPTGPVPRDVLIVVSKAKDYVRTRADMNTSDGVFATLSDRIRRLCDAAIASAARDGRKTVLDRDVPRPPAGPRVIRRLPGGR